MTPRVMFIPWVEVDPSNTERTPKLLRLLSQWYEVVPVRPGRFNKMIYDQKGNRFLRYVLFLLEEASLFLSALSTAKRENVSLVFAEGTYFSIPGALAARIRGIPMVWDNHANIRDFSATLGKTGAFFRANLLVERFLHALATAVLVVSEREREVYRELGFPGDKFVVVPTCAEMGLVRQRSVPREQARAALGVSEEEKVVLFFGTLKYHPNLDAALYISREMMPLVRSEVPRAVAYLAGSGELGEEPGEGVRTLGFVPDLQAWLSAADVCVAPMWKGVGILTKVIDMLSAGRATVVSPLALEGMPDLADGANCLIGGDRDTFPAQVVRLLRDDGLRLRLEQGGRELVERTYCWEVVAPRLHEMLDGLMEGDRQLINPPAPKWTKSGNG